MSSQKDDNLYPLKLVPLPVEKVWGGDQLARRYYSDLPTDRLIGEVWAVWGDLAIGNGPLRDARLDDLMQSRPLDLLGSRLAAKQVATFPLLVKLLDARDTLSVQVHPDDLYAQQHEGEPYGKAEVWYILDVEPGAQLIHGVKEPLTRSQVEQAIEAGVLQDKLEYVEVKTGDVVYNPPGTIHALGSGLLLYELQQSSDLTYRFFDWNRNDPNRPLHIAKSLDVADLEPYAAHTIRPVKAQEPGATRTYLCACRYFAAELLEVESHVHERPAGKCFHLLTVLQGRGRVLDVPLNCGESVLIPAAIHEYELQADDPLVAIKGYVPDLWHDIIVPLRSQGIPDETIIQLGGNPRHSDTGRLISAR
jgi:mannose-6-phosphate isomerase